MQIAEVMAKHSIFLKISFEFPQYFGNNGSLDCESLLRLSVTNKAAAMNSTDWIQ